MQTCREAIALSLTMGLLLGAPGAPVKADRGADVTNKSTYKLSVIDTATNAVEATIVAGKAPHAVANMPLRHHFDDVPPDHWAYEFIEALAESGITAGCGNGNYCPDASVTRAQMAVFLERGIHGTGYEAPECTGNVFDDVPPGSFACDFIEQLLLDGITGGCGSNNYCPAAPVTRAQMAVFLLRASHGSGYSPPPATGVFTDVPLNYWAVRWIEQLAAEGITSGCGAGNYCPGDPVTRAQMAVFLVKAFALQDAVTKIGFNFSPYEGEQDPNLGSAIPEEQIRRKLGEIRHHTDFIRTFGADATANLNAIPRIADEFGICVAVGIWLDRDAVTNATEIGRAIEAARSGCVPYIVVGSEVLLRGDLTLQQLLGYIEQVKIALPETLVTTGEIYPIWINNPELVDAVDVLFVNFYAFWEGVALDRAIAALNSYYNDVSAIADGKQIIVSETGWPSCGEPIGNAIPSEENAAILFMNYASWLDATGVTGFYFEAFDEPWKANYGEGNRGACWGVWYENGTLKPGMQAVFDGERMDDNWSVLEKIPGKVGSPSVASRAASLRSE